MSLSASSGCSFNRSFHDYAQLHRMQRSGTECKISFLPVVLELSPGVFNNSVLAVPGGFARQDTYSFSQSGRVGEEEDVWRVGCCLFLQHHGRYLSCFYLQLCSESVAFIT